MGTDEVVTHMEVESEVLDQYIDSNLFEIYISEQAFEKMVKHCYEYAPSELEVMGFLIGDKYVWKDKLYIVVQDAVTTDVDSTSVNVKFSEEGMEKLFNSADIKIDVSKLNVDAVVEQIIEELTEDEGGNS